MNILKKNQAKGFECVTADLEAAGERIWRVTVYTTVVKGRVIAKIVNLTKI